MFTTEEEEDQRLAICFKCESFREKARFFFGLVKVDKPQCAKCKCLLESKVSFKASKCPKNKW